MNEPVYDKSVVRRLATTMGFVLQQRPLSDEQLALIIRKTVAEKIVNGKDITPEDWFEFARAVERAHGITK